MKTKYRVLNRGKKGRQNGECFILQLDGENYVLGVVANNDTKWAPNVNNVLTVLFFKTEFADEKSFSLNDIIKIVNDKSALILPPIITNELGWTKGYFKTINKVDTDDISYLNDISFYNSINDITNMNGDKTEVKNIYLLGKKPLISCYGIETLLEISLDLEFTVLPPSNYNPYKYLDNLKGKYPDDLPIWFCKAKQRLEK